MQDYQILFAAWNSEKLFSLNDLLTAFAKINDGLEKKTPEEIVAIDVFSSHNGSVMDVVFATVAGRIYHCAVEWNNLNTPKIASNLEQVKEINENVLDLRIV